uniref:Bacterial surface antigen (D15) domain-containing protein n=1 Tax=Strigamia maritima TaxID=126957 RepID=T1JDX0_STRMM
MGTVNAKVPEPDQMMDQPEVVIAAHEVRTTLESLGCFKSIGTYIDTSTGPESSPHGLEVTFYVDELKRIVGGVNTLIGNNEGSLVLGMSLPNVLGRGERVQCEYSYGTKNSVGFNLAATKPLTGWKHAGINTAVYQQGNDFPWSGFRQTDKGTLLDFWFESAPKVRHTLRWEGIWRETSCLDRCTAFSVREQTGHTLKSSIKHILSVDKRDSPILPTKGVLFKLQQEFAGLGGDTGFIKHEFEFQANVPLFNDFIWQGALTGGFMHSPSSTRRYSICDKFFLGGPLTLRGFNHRGVGPRAENCALGAKAFWSGAFHLYMPMPFRPGEGGFGDLFRTHFFINAGNIGDFSFGEDYHDNLTMLLDGLRVAYGIGLVLRIGQVARFELNYCFPLRVQKHDSIAHGLQFGVGVNFL